MVTWFPRLLQTAVAVNSVTLQVSKVAVTDFITAYYYLILTVVKDQATTVIY